MRIQRTVQLKTDKKKGKRDEKEGNGEKKGRRERRKREEEGLRIALL